MGNTVNTGIGGIGDWPMRRAFLSGERTAFIEGDRRVSFADFDRRTNQLAQALRETGVRSGDRVGALMVPVSPSSKRCSQPPNSVPSSRR